MPRMTVTTLNPGETGSSAQAAADSAESDGGGAGGGGGGGFGARRRRSSYADNSTISAPDLNAADNNNATLSNNNATISQARPTETAGQILVNATDIEAKLGTSRAPSSHTHALSIMCTSIEYLASRISPQSIE